MILTLLHIRVKQLQRELRSLGLYTFLLSGVAFYLIFVSFRQFEEGVHSYSIICLLAFICVALQVYRKDKLFIYKHIENPYLQIFSEYIALTFLFAVTAIFTRSWMYYPLLLAMLFFIPYFKNSFRKTAVFKNLSLVIPVASFEWISGFRKNFIFLSGLYLLAIAFCWFRILPLFLLWFLTTTIISFYNECESLQVLRESGKPTGKYLLNKLIRSNLYIIILYTPLIIINTILNTEFLLFNLLFIPVQLSLLCFAICMKYSSYSPNKMQTGNSILLITIALFSTLPYLLPVPIILSFIYFYKARNNLNYYLND
ncbi:MAG TPA: hypothetical protein VGP55_08195 [Chitinophagaceae bacterium]|nr:hypothetical protein [Chitinophagaceae bacterium]